MNAPNPARSILKQDVFARFAVAEEIEPLILTDSHYTNALIAPLKGAPGLWIVFKWVESASRPFNFSADAGYLEVVSPEKFAREPHRLTDPERVVHLAASANVCPRPCPAECANNVMIGPMEPRIRCRMPNHVESSSESDRIVLSLMSFILDRSRQECEIARAVSQQLTHAPVRQAVLVEA